MSQLAFERIEPEPPDQCLTLFPEIKTALCSSDTLNNTCMSFPVTLPLFTHFQGRIWRQAAQVITQDVTLILAIKDNV